MYSAEDLLLRDCEEDDMPAVTAIYGRAVLTGFGTFETLPPSEAEMKIRWRRALVDRYPFIVAEDNRKILGFACVAAHRNRLAYGHTVEGSVYVREGFQWRGVGTRLLSRLVAEAAGHDYRQMVAVIGDSANKSAIRLHEKLGFSLIGTLPSVGWKHGRWLDTVLMQRVLGPGDTTPA